MPLYRGISELWEWQGVGACERVRVGDLVYSMLHCMCNLPIVYLYVKELHAH